MFALTRPKTSPLCARFRMNIASCRISSRFAGELTIAFFTDAKKVLKLSDA
ncbi:hypothetical protein D3C86_2156840 [compost metagenome]